MSNENSPEKRRGLAWPMLIVIWYSAMVAAPWLWRSCSSPS